MADKQRSRVYAWEDRVIGPCDRSRVAFPHAQAIVDHVWAAEQLDYPPLCEPLRTRAGATLVAASTRLSIWLAASTPTWTILHEIAHAMTSTLDGNAIGHDARFMGIYTRLLERYLGLSRRMLDDSLIGCGIAVDHHARPEVLDV